MLACPLRRRANLVILQPHGDGYTLIVKRGSLTLGTFLFGAEVGNAADGSRPHRMPSATLAVDAGPRRRGDNAGPAEYGRRGRQGEAVAS